MLDLNNSIDSNSFEFDSQMITFPGTETDVTAYLARPKTSEKRPAVIVIHEIFGLNDQIKRVADRFAAQGYVVFAPHLYSSLASLNNLLSPENISLTWQFMQTMPMDRRIDMELAQIELAKQPEDKRQIIQQVMGTMFTGKIPRDKLTDELVKAVEFLNKQDYIVTGKIGSVGFCFGGGMSINLACHAKIAGSIVFYGQNPEPIDLANNIECPVLGIYGGEDTRINSKLNELVTVMTSGKKDFEMKIYPGAPHAFFNETNKAGYREDAAKDAWDRSLRFFKRTLE